MGYYIVFVEGWALYAENPLMSDDVDLYRDNMLQKYGMFKWQVGHEIHSIRSFQLNLLENTMIYGIMLSIDHHSRGKVDIILTRRLLQSSLQSPRKLNQSYMNFVLNRPLCRVQMCSIRLLNLDAFDSVEGKQSVM